ncbi:hypothetical protein [Paenibacillus apiarius]|uniref:Uncharacterized protein n=1 Tax=Paenibacillus apiarius TaxID=46240 RepID=A0ABT4E031_9BACL|nr:hypothetical protein [Paenibacillus apiarius]MCY9515073.1 hypothetical protein [Paenibacillus apiarius]MCY9522941.1 hypothetical protein [Paenibacillus apiarius]MCY9553744.1 hypothetical protein [Paenibacillus apiarius]MCY9556423.1 hypothetical protein [Paenibacillus apiarius]MCY9684857.1 hypothetical protein [Paenibacillus apiarius]
MKKFLISLSALAVLAAASPAYASPAVPAVPAEAAVQEAQQITKYYALRPNELSALEGIYLKKGQQLTIFAQGNYAYYSVYDSSNHLGTFFKSNVGRIFTATEDGYLYIQFAAPSSFTINHITATYKIS